MSFAKKQNHAPNKSIPPVTSNISPFISANELPDTTKIIIAQRISSVQDADCIIVMEGGKIDGCGTHEQLLKENAIYKEIYESQTKGDEQ